MDRACCDHMQSSIRLHHVRRPPPLPAARRSLTSSHVVSCCRQNKVPWLPEVAYSLHSKQSIEAAAAHAVSAPRLLASVQRCCTRRAAALCSSFSADSVGPLHEAGEELPPWPPQRQDWRTPRGLALAARRGAAAGAPSRPASASAVTTRSLNGSCNEPERSRSGLTDSDVCTRRITDACQRAERA